MGKKPHVFAILVGAGALIGLLFASVSTFDFARHLDRQVHDVYCSFVPGLAGPEAGESGCQVTLVSPYSSVLRTRIWGGVPVSLLAMGVFAFVLFFAAELVLTGRQRDPRATAFLALATGLPALSSVVMGYIAVVELDAVCKLCIGIYLASAIAMTGGVLLWLRARRLAAGGRSPLEHATATTVATRAAGPARPNQTARLADDDPAWITGRSTADLEQAIDDQLDDEPAHDEPPVVTEAVGAVVGYRYLAVAFAVGILFVAVPFSAYVIAAPDHSRFIGTCGTLPQPQDEYGVMVAIDPRPGAVPAIEILDPLCPACSGFEQRLDNSALGQELDRRVLLMPLDDSCNWMVDTALHPGACAVSEAVLCAGDRAGEVLAWAFDNHAQIRAAAADDDQDGARIVRERFPELASCVGSPAVRAKLNRSLRWAVRNRLPVLTPQLYIGGVKLCDEDVDIGLEYALSRMLSAYRAGTLQAESVDDGQPVDPGLEPLPVVSAPATPRAVARPDRESPGDLGSAAAAAPPGASPTEAGAARGPGPDEGDAPAAAGAERAGESEQPESTDEPEAGAESASDTPAIIDQPGSEPTPEVEPKPVPEPESQPEPTRPNGEEGSP